MNYLGQLRHPNLVKLIGYCCEDHHRLLVYEYMESGSLEKHLFPSEYSISMGVHVGKGETNLDLRKSERNKYSRIHFLHVQYGLIILIIFCCLH